MKKIAVFLLSLFVFSQARAAGTCVPGVGYTLVSSVASIVNTDGGGLNAMIYPKSGKPQGSVQQKLFINMVGDDNHALRINLIPEPTLSSYMNLWVPGYCDLTYNDKGTVSSTTCTQLSATLASTATIGSFLENYATGHRGYFVTNRTGDSYTTKMPVYMPHTKCQNETNGDPCYLGGSSSVAQPYLNAIDKVYPGANYYAALLYKWNASQRGFVFPIKQDEGSSSISIAAVSNHIPNQQSDLAFLTSGNNTYIPIASAGSTIRTNFSSDFINVMSQHINNNEKNGLNGLKLVCNLFYLANDKVSYCMNINGITYNKYYYNDVRENASTNNMNQYLYNLLSCSGQQSKQSNNKYQACRAPFYEANFYVDTNFDTNFSNYYMQSKIEDGCKDSNGNNSNCVPNEVTSIGSYTNVFSDYTSSSLSLKNLTKQKSTGEPVLMLKSNQGDYTLSFVSDCIDETKLNQAVFDFTNFKEKPGSGNTNKMQFNYIEGTSFKPDVIFPDVDFSKAPGNVIVTSTSTVNFSGIDKIYLTNNYIDNGGYSESSSVQNTGNCAVAEPSVSSTGMIQFVFVPTGVCGGIAASQMSLKAASSNSSDKGSSESGGLSPLFVAPGE